jgi:hypothetical protein
MARPTAEPGSVQQLTDAPEKLLGDGIRVTPDVTQSQRCRAALTAICQSMEPPLPGCQDDADARCAPGSQFIRCLWGNNATNMGLVGSLSACMCRTQSLVGSIGAPAPAPLNQPNQPGRRA